jgi:hypothetical protein
MITLNITKEELNTILHGLYLLEDQSWFFDKDQTDNLIARLNNLEEIRSNINDAICDY